MKKILLLFVLITYSSALPQEDLTEISKKIVKYTLENEYGYNMLKEFCKIGPRLSGSENSLNAINWAFKKLKEIGADTVWLQPVMVPHWVRGNTASLIQVKGESKKTSYNVAAFGSSVSTPPNGITAQIIEVKSIAEVDSLKEKVKGKIVFYNRPLDKSLINTFAGYGGAVDQRFRGASTAAKYGALAVIVRSITTKYDNNYHVGTVFFPDSTPKIPALAIGQIDADILSKVIKAEKNFTVNIKTDCKTLPDVLSYNVIAEIKGSEFPDEIVLVGGHSDSWDLGDGAHDDGAGCIHSMEVLKIIKDLNLKPKRTIRVVLFINEENGVRGALKYAAYSDSLKLNHIAAIESDRGGFTPRGFDADTDSLTFIKLNSYIEFTSNANAKFLQKGGGGVDIGFLRNAKSRIGFVPDEQKYMDLHHSSNDVFSEVHPRELELGSAAITILAYVISQKGL